MEWDDSINSGFSKAKDIYLPVSGKTSVKEQEEDKDSLLSTVKKLIEVKKECSLFDVDNDINFLRDDEILIFERTDGVDSVFVCINLSDSDFEIKNIKKRLYSEKMSENKVSPGGFVIFK